MCICSLHYKEYLVGLINRNNIDPVVIMDEQQLKIQLNRLNKNVPKRKQNEAEKEYKKRLLQVGAYYCASGNIYATFNLVLIAHK